MTAKLSGASRGTSLAQLDYSYHNVSTGSFVRSTTSKTPMQMDKKRNENKVSEDENRRNSARQCFHSSAGEREHYIADSAAENLPKGQGRQPN